MGAGHFFLALVLDSEWRRLEAADRVSEAERDRDLLAAPLRFPVVNQPVSDPPAIPDVVTGQPVLPIGWSPPACES